MPELLRILVLEDRPSDIELMLHALRQTGFEIQYEHVDNEAAYLAHLDEKLDVILADYTLPQFDALRALELLQARGLDTPFIVVTGTVSEEAAVECMKRGAADYLLKDRLARLGLAVTQSLHAKRLHGEKRRIEAERRRLSTAIEQTVECVIITDTEGTILYVNPAFEHVTGYTYAEVIGQNPRILKSGQHDAAFYKELWSTLRAGENWHGRFVNKKKDGTLFTVNASISPVRDDTGNIVNYVDVQRDITHELELEQQYFQGQKMEAVGRLASGVAHDFNNVLTAITGYTELMLDALDENEPSYQYLVEIQKAIDRASSLTRQLLIFSRKQAIQPQTLDLNELLRNVEKMLRRLIGEDIELRAIFDPEIGCIWADAGQLEQVIINLAVNARDAMPMGGQLTIKTADVVLDDASIREYTSLRPGSYVCLSVQDTGVGMDEDVRLHAFEPFFTTKEAGKGTGLGLATVHGIVQQCGGEIILHSQPGQGTMFEIYLPQVDDEE